MAGDSPVANVSDTARWVAQYRANESARPDALFRDPLAARLAGERGRAILADAPRKLRNGWSIVARTKIIDDLVAACVAEGCARVVNLAAGLDTRPYRLPLPASLVWIEADLPALMDEKERLLAGETPVCAVTRARVDLADTAARAAFLGGLAGDERTLVITEGLVQYLDDATVAALARDLAGCAPVHWWIVDLISPGALAMIKGTRGHRAASMMGFAPADGVGFFEAAGPWRAREVRSIVREAIRLRRAPWFMRPFAWAPDPDPRAPGAAKWFGVTRLERG